MELDKAKEKIQELRLAARRKINHPTTLKLASAVGEMSRRAVHLTSATSFWGKAGVVAAGVGRFIGSAPSLYIHYPEHYELQALNRDMKGFIFECLYENDALEDDLSVSDEFTAYLKGDEEKSIVFLVAVNSGGIRKVKEILYKDYDTEEDMLAVLREAFWANSKSQRLYVEKANGGYEAVPDPMQDSAESEAALQIFEDTKAYNEAGYARSELLVGPPGTGKSYIARHVAQLREDRSIRANYSYDAADVLIQMAHVLRPRTIILDDICRGSVNLDMVEELLDYTQLLIATANYINRIDPAVQRPGRFNNIRVVTKLDEAAASRMLPNLDPDKALEIAQLPAAYIEEFRVTQEVHGTEAALDRVEELKSRAKRIEKMIEKDTGTAESVPLTPFQEDEEE